MCLACVNLPGSVIVLQIPSSLEVCVMYLTIHYTAVLSFCRRYPTGRWNGAVSPTSSTPVHDLYVTFLVSWIVSVGCAVCSDLLASFSASWKLLALANIYLSNCSSHCFDAAFSLVQQPLLLFPYAWVCVSGQTGVLSVQRWDDLQGSLVSLKASVVAVALSICFFCVRFVALYVCISTNTS